MMNSTSMPQEDAVVSAKTTQQWVLWSLMVLLTTWTIVGNVLLILTMLRQKWGNRGDLHLMVTNLGAINCAMGLLVMPINIQVYMNNAVWELPNFVCKGFIIAEEILCCCLAFALVVMNTERLFFTLHPSHHIKTTQRWHTVLKLLLPWVASVACVLPLYLWSEGLEMSAHGSKTCYVVMTDVTTIVLTILTFYLPALLIFITIISSISIVTCSVREDHVVSLAIILCIVDVVHFISYMPYTTLRVLQPVGIGEDLPPGVNTTFHWMEFLFSAVMPLLWLAFKDYRSGCKRTLTCKTRKQRPQSYLDDSIQLNFKY